MSFADPRSCLLSRCIPAHELGSLESNQVIENGSYYPLENFLFRGAIELRHTLCIMMPFRAEALRRDEDPKCAAIYGVPKADD